MKNLSCLSGFTVACLLVLPFGPGARAQDEFDIFTFDPFADGPWSEVDLTTLDVPKVANESVELDGVIAPDEYGEFEPVTVTPGVNAYILDWPVDRSWDEPEDSSFTFYLAHDDDFFYVAVEALDDFANSDNDNLSFWKDDAVELVIDALNERSTQSTEGTNPYGGHCYINFEGAISEADSVTGAQIRDRWSSAVDWTYGELGDVWGYGEEGEDGWTMEIRFHKRLFEDPDVGNVLDDGYVMGFNIGLDDDDGRGPEGANGTGERSKDLEIQYWWAHRTAATAGSGGRLTHAATGEIIFLAGDIVAETPFLRGDSNSSGKVDLSDAVFTLTHLYLGGPPPECRKSADANDSGVADLSDAVYALNHLFIGGPTIPAPYPECGTDLVPDDLPCESYSAACE